MSKICYVPRSFRGASLDTITMAETICEEYAEQGITITLRQLYYQFVARGYQGLWPVNQAEMAA